MSLTFVGCRSTRYQNGAIRFANDLGIDLDFYSKSSAHPVAVYNSNQDKITVKKYSASIGSEYYFFMILNELARWTGHSERLNRYPVTDYFLEQAVAYNTAIKIAEKAQITEFKSKKVLSHLKVYGSYRSLSLEEQNYINSKSDEAVEYLLSVLRERGFDPDSTDIPKTLVRIIIGV